MTESGNKDDFGGQEGSDRLFGKEQKPPTIESQDIKGEEPKVSSVERRNQPKLVNEETPAQEDKDNAESLLRTVEAAVVVAGTELGKKIVNEGVVFAKRKIRKALGIKSQEKEVIKPEAQPDQSAIKHFDDQKKEYDKKLGDKSFVEIQNELKRQVGVMPASEDGKKFQAEKIEKLQIERSIIINAAVKDLNLLEKLKRHFADVQLSEKDFSRAIDKILQIDIDKLEKQYRAEFYWNDKFAGILQEYRDVAVLNMELALLKAEGHGNSDQAKKMQRQIDILGWGYPPSGLERLAREYIEGNTPKAPEPAAGRADGPNWDRLFPSGEILRKRFLDSEEAGELIEGLSPLTNNLYEGLSGEDRKFWEFRFALSNGRARKQIAGVDTFGDNPEIMNFTKEAFDTVTNHKGVAEAISIYSVFIANPEFSERMKDQIGMTTTRLVSIEVKDPDGSKRMEGVTDLKKLRDFRNEFRNYLSVRFSLTPEEARDAEQVAYNFMYISNVTEESDKSADPKLRNIMNDALRDTMHPRAKLLDALVTKDRWPKNVFGEWAYYNRNRLISNSELIPLAETLFPSFLDKTNVLGRGTDKKRDPKKRKEYLFGGIKNSVGIGKDVTRYPTLKDSILSEGKRLLNEEIDSTKIDWNLESTIETPYTIYAATQLNRAAMIYSTIVNAELPRGRSLQDLENGFRTLGTVDRRMRETILYLVYNKDFKFLKPSQRDFKPNLSGSAMDGFMSRVKRELPEFFK